MSLRDQAEQDLRSILGDTSGGFAWPITIKDPAGNTASLTGFSNDIAQVIDPDTGQAVSGRLASVVVNTADLQNSGLGLPVGIADTTSKPWVVTFDDINGTSHTFKVSQSNPDRAIGCVSCILESYTDAA